MISSDATFSTLPCVMVERDPNAPPPIRRGPSGSPARSSIVHGIDAEPVGDELGEYRLVPLPVRARRHVEPHAARRGRSAPPPRPSARRRRRRVRGSSAQPMPRSTPRARASSRRAGKPAQSDSRSAISSRRGKSPLSNTLPVGVRVGHPAGRGWRCGGAARTGRCRARTAAWSTRRSMR